MSMDAQTTIADLLMGRLKERGLKRFFGVPGGGSSMDLIDAGRRAGLKFVLSRREDAGTIMAVVTAWLSDAPGLALATKGPGLTSAANGIASAYLDRAPVLFVSDGFGADERGYVSHQYFDQAAVLDPITKANSTLSGDNPAAEIDGLLAILSTPPKGPAYIELTGATAKRSVAMSPTFTNAKPAQTIGDVEAALELIRKARRPVIVAGFESTVENNATAVRRMAATLNVPALVTYMAKGVIPDVHDNFAGIFTGGQAEFPCVSQADLIILAGLDPVELIRKPWAYNASVLDIGEVRHSKHYLTPDAGLYGPIAATIDRLMDSLMDSVTGAPLATEWTGPMIAGQRENFAAAMAFPARPAPTTDREPGLTPEEIVKMAAAAFPVRPRLAVDAGAHMFSATAFWPACDPYDVLISNGLATMAFALPAAIAAALHDPVRGAVAMTGDGGLMMCMGELVTVAQQNANLTVIVFNDGSLSLIDIKRQEMQLPDLGFTWTRPDFATTARGLGLTAHQVSTAPELQLALTQAAAHPGPTLIDVTLEPQGYLEQMRALRG